MSPIELIILCLAGGVALLIGELLLPTHGVLGAIGAMSIAVAVALCFSVNRWLGLGVFLVLLLTSPWLFSAGMKLWAHTPVGRRMILKPVYLEHKTAPVQIGQVGTTLTQLRPMGEGEFNSQRIQVKSELGIIEPGQQIKVIAIDNGRPTVRMV